MGPKVHVRSHNGDFPYHMLSFPLNARVAEEIADYIIDFEWTETQIGRYTSGQKAIGRHCKVIITNRSTGKRVGTRTFRSEPPSPSIPAGNFGPSHSTPSYKAIDAFLVQWYSDPDEFPPSEVAKEWAKRVPILRLLGASLGALFMYFGLSDLLVDDPIRDAMTGGGSTQQESLIVTIVSGLFIAFSLFVGWRKKKKQK